LDSIPQVTVQELAAKLGDGDCSVLDVREPGEIEQGAIADSIRIPLGDLSKRADQLSQQNSYSVHCKSGYRSSIAVSILRRAGFRDVSNVVGGFDGWKAAGLPVTQDPKTKVCSG
jgi:rhodanese-related sulfurtransferase